jgi:6-phosphogluconate dehydrogenase
MQIGFVGLGKMGGNMVRRILRDSDHEVVGFNIEQEVTQGLAQETGSHGPSG